MKKQFLFFMLVVAFACDKKEPIVPAPTPIKINSTLVLLQIDYLTNQFEGGKTYNFNYTANALADSIPLAYFQEGAEIGTILVSFIPTSDTVFCGTTRWQQVGDRKIPLNLDQPNSFFENSSPLALPDFLNYQTFPPTIPHPSASIFSPVWNGVNHLQIVKECLDKKGKFGLARYERGQPGPLEDRDWYLVLYTEKVVGASN